MDRIYLDHNATSPLAASVKRWLAGGDAFWANPSSQHSSGKRARVRLEEASEALHRVCGLPATRFRLVLHSGATEGVNSFVQGHASVGKILYAYSPLDHACVRAQVARLESQGHGTLALPVDGQGELRLEEAVAALERAKAKSPHARLLANWTWSNNETGVVWPLSLAAEFKRRTGALVHVDAAQAPGKVADWAAPDQQLDAYTFSAHKCGGLVGTGWSFLASGAVPPPWMLGGGQQEGLRAGTENVLGAWAAKLALEEMAQNFDPVQLDRVISRARAFLDSQLAGKGLRVAAGARHLNLNTLLFVSGLPSDRSLPLFDLTGLELSAGSACASGSARPSPLLEALGLGKWAKNGLRLSLPWSFREADWVALEPRLAQVLEKLPSATI